MSPSTTMIDTAGAPIAAILGKSDGSMGSIAHVTWIAPLAEVTVPQMLAQFHKEIAYILGPYRSRVDVTRCVTGNGRVALCLRWHASGVGRDALYQTLIARAGSLPGSLSFTVSSGTGN